MSGGAHDSVRPPPCRIPRALLHQISIWPRHSVEVRAGRRCEKSGRRRWPNDSVAAQGGFARTHERNVIIMEIKRAGSQPSAKGPSDWFAGSVRIDPLFQAPDPALVQG